MGVGPSLVGCCHYAGEDRRDKIRPVSGQEGREMGTEVLEGVGEAEERSKTETKKDDPDQGGLNGPR